MEMNELNRLLESVQKFEDARKGKINPDGFEEKVKEFKFLVILIKNLESMKKGNIDTIST